jgi:hypothetical protein
MEERFAVGAFLFMSASLEDQKNRTEGFEVGSRNAEGGKESG